MGGSHNQLIQTATKPQTPNARSAWFDTATCSALVEDCRIRTTLVWHPTSQSIPHSSLFREKKEETADTSVEFLRGQIFPNGCHQFVWLVVRAPHVRYCQGQYCTRKGAKTSFIYLHHVSLAQYAATCQETTIHLSFSRYTPYTPSWTRPQYSSQDTLYLCTTKERNRTPCNV
jgi:hypothetical protein